MPDVDAVFQEPARHFREDLKRQADRDHLSFVIRTICEDARIEDELKFEIPSRDRPATVFADGRFVVIFRHLNNWTISILNIAYDKDFIPLDDIE